MPSVHALTLIPTDPGGPQRGDLVEVGDDGVLRVLRRTAFGRREEASRPLNEVRGAVAGPAGAVAGTRWLTAGASIAARSAASPVGGGEEPSLLAVSVPGPVMDETWLFRGSETAVAAVAAALGGAVRTDSPEAVERAEPTPPTDGGWDGTTPDAVDPEVADTGSAEVALRRRRWLLPVAGGLVVLAAGSGGALFTSVQDRISEGLEDLLPTTDAPAVSAEGFPSLTTGFRPHRAVDLIRVWSVPRAAGGGLRPDASAPPAPSGRTLRMGFLWRGRPFRVVLAPSPAAAARIRPRGTARAGNLVFRDGVPPAGRRALLAALTRPPRASAGAGG